MTAQLIDGKAIADGVVQAVTAVVAQLKHEHRLQPGLATVLVGDHPASQTYVRNKIRQSEAAGLRSFAHHLPPDVNERELLTLVLGLNRNPDVNGILVQLPLPPQINPEAVLSGIDPEKDVDGFHVVNAGRLVTGSGRALVPCTPSGCLMLINSVRRDLNGLHAVVVGRSNIVGKPMAQLLLDANCTVTIAHSKTVDLPGVCRTADVLVAAVGRPRMVAGDWVKPGAIVIDVGINRIVDATGRGRLVGDVDFEAALPVAGAITPVPGGVGPMTVACLLRNTVIAACRQHRLEDPEII